MKKKNIVIASFILLIMPFCFQSYAQNKVSGSVADAKSNKPLQFVNISLLRVSDSVLVSHTAANSKGDFVMEYVPNGSYRLVAYFVGYENYEQRLDISKDINIGTLKLTPGTTTIGEVVVKGERPLFTVDGEKTLYNTAEDPSVQTGTASDVLQNAPGVSVDVGGNVSLRGSSSVEIWINDKPSHMNAENLKTYLQQMPANSIDHVEVITNPSARYGSKADGIINIVTTTKVKRNQFVSFGANASIRPYASPWFSYVWSNEKLSINLYSNFSYSRDKHGGTSDMTIFQPSETGRDTVSFEKASSNSVGHDFGSGLHFNLDYEIDSMNSLSFWSGIWPNWNFFDSSEDLYRKMYLNPGEINYLERSKHKGNGYWAGGGLYFEHKFDEDGQVLSLDINGDAWGWGLIGNNAKRFSPEYIRLRNNDNRYSSFNIEGELTYTLPYSEKGELSLGYYGNFERETTRSIIDTLANNVWVPDAMRSYVFHTPTIENQIFLTLQHNFGNFSIKPGVRLEHTYTVVSYPEAIPDTFGVKRHFFHVRPSLHLSYRTESMHNFRLSYTFRSKNPNAEQLTKFIEYDEDSFKSGNPELLSILTHSLEANWQKYWTKYGSVGLTLYYRAKSRDINTISVPDYHDIYGRFVSHSYPVNVGKSMNTGLEFNTMYRPNAMFNMRLYANVYHTYLETMYNNEQYKNQMWSYSFSLSLWAKLWKRLEISISGNYNSPTLSLFSTTRPYYGINAGLRADFFDKKLSVYLNATDIFNWNSWGQNTDSPYLVSHNTYKFNSRSVSLGFTLRFGKMELENQARQGSGSEGGGAGRGM